jgi:O-acetyl-ADP-ribose deacetylase (regulator of RNase III)
VIHTVGPVYKDGRHGEPELLASCYRESLKLASALGIKSLAFPSISTGVYGYPMEDAARIAVKTVADYLARHPQIERVRLVLFGRAAYEVYARVLQEL